MLFSLQIPTRVFGGRGCVSEHLGDCLPGRRAYLVTGASGARKSGALQDVCDVLTARKIPFDHFDGVKENPSLALCYEAGRKAAEAKADFVIGIGGGSALDAAKAVAAFAANPAIAPMDLFDVSALQNDPLPVLAIPTTAGTGSEVNVYSVLTLDDDQGLRKKTFKDPRSWPKAAFLDPAYTASLPRTVTISTALDAFHHALESYLSPKTTVVSELFALYAAKQIWEVLTQYPDTFTEDLRAALQNAACAAGIAISVTGTGFPHPLGYSLSLMDGIPHGAACAAFAEDYLTYNEKSPAGKERLESFYAALGTTGKVMKTFLPALADVHLTFTEEEIAQRLAPVVTAGNYQNSPYVLSREEMFAIYRRLFGAKHTR